MPNKCPRCNSTVYFAEEKRAAGKVWHKLCLKCKDCNKLLSSTNIRDKEGEIYCTSCHGRKFGTKGYGYGVGAGILSMDTVTAGEIVNTAPRTYIPSSSASTNRQTGNGCPHCGKVVYDAEKMIACSKKWHKSCFKCHKCGKILPSTDWRDHEDGIYCKACYNKLFGPKGFGYGTGAGSPALSLTE